MLLAADSERKLSRAIKKGQVENCRDLADTLKAALANDVLTSNEATLIEEANAARWDAIQTDSFSPEWFDKFNPREQEHQAVA